MRIEKTLELADGPVTVKELTLGEIRAWLAGQEAGDGAADVVGVLLLEDLSLAELRLLTDLSAERMDGLAPSELHGVVVLAKEVNKDFFGLRAVLAPIRQRLAEALSAPSAA